MKIGASIKRGFMAHILKAAMPTVIVDGML